MRRTGTAAFPFACHHDKFVYGKLGTSSRDAHIVLTRLFQPHSLQAMRVVVHGVNGARHFSCSIVLVGFNEIAGFSQLAHDVSLAGHQSPAKANPHVIVLGPMCRPSHGRQVVRRALAGDNPKAHRAYAPSVHRGGGVTTSPLQPFSGVSPVTYGIFWAELDGDRVSSVRFATSG